MIRPIALSLLLIDLWSCSSAPPHAMSAATSTAIARATTFATTIPRIEVSATLEDTKDSPKIAFKLTNRSSVVLDVYARDLPWGNVKSLTVVAVEASYPSAILPRNPPLDLSIPEVVHLLPNANIEGRVTLSTFFPDIEDFRQDSDILILWSFRLMTVGGDYTDRFSGIVEIPQL